MATPKKAPTSRYVSVPHWNGSSITFNLDDVYIVAAHVFNKRTDRHIADIPVGPELEAVLELMKS